MCVSLAWNRQRRVMGNLLADIEEQGLTDAIVFATIEERINL